MMGNGIVFIIGLGYTKISKEIYMRIYLDNCCYNRLLDDRSYSQIYYERNSIMLILELAGQSAIDVIGSEMLIKEMADTNDMYKRAVLQMQKRLK